MMQERVKSKETIQNHYDNVASPNLNLSQSLFSAMPAASGQRCDGGLLMNTCCVLIDRLDRCITFQGEFIAIKVGGDTFHNTTDTFKI